MFPVSAVAHDLYLCIIHPNPCLLPSSLPKPSISASENAEISMRLDESDAFSALSCQTDGETDRFTSTCATGRRVSFNESALYEQEKRTEDKVRR